MAKENYFVFSISDADEFSTVVDFSVVDMSVESAVTYILSRFLNENYTISLIDEEKKILVNVLKKNSQSSSPVSTDKISNNNENSSLNANTEIITPQIQNTKEKDPDEGKALIDIPLLPPTTPGGQPMTLREFHNLNYEHVPSGVFSHLEGELPPLKPGDKPMTIREFEEFNRKSTDTSTAEDEKVLLPPVKSGGAPMTKEEFNKLRYEEEVAGEGNKRPEGLLPPVTPNGKPMTIQEFKSLQYE